MKQFSIDTISSCFLLCYRAFLSKGGARVCPSESFRKDLVEHKKIKEKSFFFFLRHVWLLQQSLGCHLLSTSICSVPEWVSSLELKAVHV